MARFRWKVPPSKAFSASKWHGAILLAVELALLRWSPEIEAYAKASAPWQDQTGNARQRLESHVDKPTPDVLRLVLKHRVEYGKYLELGYAGRYRVIMPTLETYYNRVWADVKRVME